MLLVRRIMDLKLPKLPDQDWGAAERLDALSILFRHSESYVVQAIDWYFAKRSRPAKWSRLLRATAVCAAVLGGIVPLVHSAAPGLIASDWGFVLLAGGAGCILVDRVFGYSSSWTRFSRTGLALQYTLARAQTEWLSALLSCSDQPSEEESAALLSVIRRLYAEVQQIMEEETATWIGYLTESLEELAFTTAHSNSLPAQSDSAPRLPIKTGQASRSSAVDSGEAEAS